MIKVQDKIMVWFCENCSCYEIDFLSQDRYCFRCGNAMQKRTYLQKLVEGVEAKK